MGRFSEELRRLIKERGVKQADFQKKAGIAQSSIWAMLHGRLPSDPGTVDRIAGVLSVSAEKLLRLVVLDRLEEICKRYGISYEELTAPDHNTGAEIPLYPSVEKAVMCLDNRGIPVIRPFHAIRLSGNLYREGMYAVKVVDNRLYPVVEKGTVVVVNPGEDISHTDIAVVSTAEETGLYRIIRFRRNTYVIETLQPYSYRLLEQKDIRYISRITIIIRKELP